MITADGEFSPTAGLAWGRFGRNCEYGCSMFGYSVYGEEPVVLYKPPAGSFLVSGVYRREHGLRGIFSALSNYYIPKNPRTEAQQANRQKMSDAVSAWQDLTPFEKNCYNAFAVGKKLSGYNLFLKNYLRSH
jgi:hypothetical protein